MKEWVEAFNRADVDALSELCAEDAVNHQVADAPLRGREAIRAIFAASLGGGRVTTYP